MQYKFVEEKFKYDGTQLKSLFAYMDHHILGDSIIAWQGPCDIPFAHMVDGEDVLAQAEIRGDHMLHFIIEEFGKNLELAVAHQRLFAGLVFEELCAQMAEVPAEIKRLRRSGDDIYVDDGKLSISIATVSPVSALIHFAVNVTNANTPVKTSCLNDLGFEPKGFAQNMAARFIDELKTINEACCKVRWVN